MSPPVSRKPRLDTAPPAYFFVYARAEPGVMPRVLELFAKRGLVPSRWHSMIDGPNDRRLAIDIQMRNMDRDSAKYVAACLRQIVGVVAVTSRKTHSDPPRKGTSANSRRIG